MERLRARAAWSADPPAALRCRDRQICGVQLGRGVRRDRRGATSARSQVGGLLFVGAHQPRGVVYVRADGANVRQPEPARQLEHVSRIDLGRAEGGDRRAGRHDAARGFRPYRRDLLLRPECRVERAAHAPQSARLPQARRRDHHLQSAARARARTLHRSAESDRDGDARRDDDLDPISPGQGGRRHRRDDGDRQVSDRMERRRDRRRRAFGARRRFHQPAQHRLRCLRRRGAPGRLGGDRGGIGADQGGDRSGGQGLRQGEGGDGDLRHGDHPARQGRRERPHDHEPAADARQYRQAGRGADPGTRPFERPGAAHRRHHREDRAGSGRFAGKAIWLHRAAREGARYRRSLPRRDRRHGQGLRRARRQFPARGPRNRI